MSVSLVRDGISSTTCEHVDNRQSDRLYPQSATHQITIKYHPAIPTIGADHEIVSPTDLIVKPADGRNAGDGGGGV